MKLDYHYGRQAFQYAMVEIPLLMFIDDAFEPLSIEAMPNGRLRVKSLDGSFSWTN